MEIYNVIRSRGITFETHPHEQGLKQTQRALIGTIPSHL